MGSGMPWWLDVTARLDRRSGSPWSEANAVPGDFEREKPCSGRTAERTERS